MQQCDLKRIAIHELGHYFGLRDAGVTSLCAAKIIIEADGGGRFNNGLLNYGTPTQHIIMLCAGHEAEKICGVSDGFRRDSYDQQKLREIAAAAGLKAYHLRALRKMARAIVRSRAGEIKRLARKITGVGTFSIR
jgi:hypothetical protein